MKKYAESFVEFLDSTEKEDVFSYLASRDKIEIQKIREAYGAVIEEIKSIPVQNSPFPFVLSFVDKESDPFSDEDWINVSTVNPDYVRPYPDDLRPWGGNSDDENDAPEGHFNVNWKGYNETYGFGFGNWGDSVFGPVFIKDEKVESELNTPAKIVGEILWEMTFHGWSQKTQKDFLKELDRRAGEIK